MIALLAREVAGLGHVVAGALSPLARRGRPSCPGHRAHSGDRPGQPALQPLRRRRARALRLRRRGPHRCLLPQRRPDRRRGQYQSRGRRRSGRIRRCAFPAPSARPISISWCRRSCCSARSIAGAAWCGGSSFISAPGKSPENVYRRGGPKALVTGLASFAFTDRFRLVSIHPGHDLAELGRRRASSSIARRPPVTTPPPASELALIRGRIREEVAETYPVFAAGLEATARSAAP